MVKVTAKQISDAIKRSGAVILRESAEGDKQKIARAMSRAQSTLEDIVVQLRYVRDDFEDRPNGGGLAFTALEEMIEHIEATQQDYLDYDKRSKADVKPTQRRKYGSGPTARTR